MRSPKPLEDYQEKVVFEMESRGVSILDGARIREELKRVGLTQRELAKRIGVREATVSDAMRGHACSPDVIFRLALGLSLAEPAT